MRASIVLSLGFLNLVAGTCKEYAKNYYESLGCTPESHDEAGCPISYDCSALSQRSPDKCHFQGNAYDEGHQLENSSPCLVNCRCEKSPLTRGRLDFSCLDVECPEFFRPRLPPGCYYVHEHDKCCSVRHVCGGQQKDIAEQCEYKGQTYAIGQVFYREEEPCRMCICQPGFNGSFTEPTCRKFSCDYELSYISRIKDGCIPVFYEKRCCPIDWRCPASSDSVITQVSKSGPDSGKTCQFGELTLHIGDKLNDPTPERFQTDCSCNIPPHPLCVREPE